MSVAVAALYACMSGHRRERGGENGPGKLAVCVAVRACRPVKQGSSLSATARKQVAVTTAPRKAPWKKDRDSSRFHNFCRLETDLWRFLPLDSFSAAIIQDSGIVISDAPI